MQNQTNLPERKTSESKKAQMHSAKMDQIKAVCHLFDPLCTMTRSVISSNGEDRERSGAGI